MATGVNGLQIIRLIEELDNAAQRLDSKVMESQLQSLGNHLKPFVAAYNPAEPNNSAETLKSYVVQGSSATIELCQLSKSFIREVLAPSGLLSAVGSNSMAVAELTSFHPSYFARERNLEELRNAGANGAVFRELFEEYSRASDLRMRVTFFSPSQMEADLLEALNSTIKMMSEIHQHDTDWWGVVRGAAAVGFGLVSKFGGAAACLTGVGCAVGAAGIVGGTISILEGVNQIGNALNTP